jgi:hypothetical protein
MADTHAVAFLEQNDDPSTARRTLRPVLWCLYLFLCALVGSGIAEYQKLLPLAHERGLGTFIVLKESFRRFDPAFAALGLLVGIATLAILVWTSRGKSAD